MVAWSLEQRKVSCSFNCKTLVLNQNISIYFKKYMILDSTDWFIGTDILPNKDFPIIFRNVNGVCLRDEQSSYNEEELDYRSSKTK